MDQFNIILQECFFGDSTKHSLFVKIQGCLWGVGGGGGRGGGGGHLFFLIIYIENFCQKPLDRFQYNLAEMFLLLPSTKIVQAVMIRQKTRPLGGGAYFAYIRGMFEMNCLLSSSSISTWGTLKTNTYLYRIIQYLHNGV